MASPYLTTCHSQNTYISRIFGKENYVQAFFQKKLGHCLRVMKVKSYQMYIHPIIEYAAVIWSSQAFLCSIIQQANVKL